MISKLLLFSIFFSNCVFVLCNKWNCTDYYWRDYHGTTPNDAVPAGKDQNGNLRYIGLAYLRGYELLPGTILPQQGIIRTTAYSNILNTSKHVKILCSPHKEAFEWIQVQSKDLHDYFDRALIPGGSEVGESLYIGRVFWKSDVIIGKIFRHERTNKGIWFAADDGIHNLLTYEVLWYNCDNVNDPKIDLRIKTE